jgi:hypothetical protein
MRTSDWDCGCRVEVSRVVSAGAAGACNEAPARRMARRRRGPARRRVGVRGAGSRGSKSASTNRRSQNPTDWSLCIVSHSTPRSTPAPGYRGRTAKRHRSPSSGTPPFTLVRRGTSQARNGYNTQSPIHNSVIPTSWSPRPQLHALPTPVLHPPSFVLSFLLRVDPYGVILHILLPRVLAQAAPSKGPPSASVCCPVIRG